MTDVCSSEAEVEKMKYFFPRYVDSEKVIIFSEPLFQPPHFMPRGRMLTLGIHNDVFLRPHTSLSFRTLFFFSIPQPPSSSGKRLAGV